MSADPETSNRYVDLAYETGDKLVGLVDKGTATEIEAQLATGWLQ